MTNKEAIGELEYILVGHPETSTRGQAVLMAMEALKQSERKRGRWMMNSGLGTMCSNCYYKLETTGLPSKCPCCGAEMEW